MREITLNDGNLELNNFDNSSVIGEGFDAKGGQLDIVDSKFNMYDNYTVSNDVDVNLFDGSTVTVKDGAELNLDDKDYWGGEVKVDGGDFIGTEVVFDGRNSQKWNQSSGSTTFNDSSNVAS